MRCSFCIEHNRHSVKVPENFDYIVPLVERVLQSTNKKQISFVIYGGELFHDGIKQSTFDQYVILFDNLKQLVSKYNKTCTFNLTTNLVHKKRQRVLDLLHKLNITRLHCSFDLADRFTNDKLLSTFIDNVQWYANNGIQIVIGFIANQSNIDQFYSNGKLVQTFNELYSKYPVYFDYYHPTNSNSKIVDERTLAQFLIFLDKNYPNIVTLQNYRDNHAHNVTKTCCPACFIIDNKLIQYCCDFPSVAKTYALKKQCMLCEYEDRCMHPCIRIMNNDSYCFVKQYFKYLDNS